MTPTAFSDARIVVTGAAGFLGSHVTDGWRGGSGPIDPETDPEVRCPDISLARRALDWEATTSLADGLARTVAWYRRAD